MNQYPRDEILIAINTIDNSRVLFLDQDANPVYTDGKPPIDEQIVIAKILQIRNDKPMNELRKIRNGLLFETDIYMLSDYPQSQQQRSDILAYRQALRTLPEQLQSQILDINDLYQY